MLQMDGYVVDYSEHKVPHTLGPFDEEGIPLLDPKHFRIAGKPLYHPIVIIQYGLGQYNMFKNGNSAAEEVFLKCAEWIERQATREEGGRFVSWPYNFPLRTPRVKAPWISGIAQGQALSLLARAYAMTGSESTLKTAAEAAQAYKYDVREGGIVTKFSHDSYFVEEIAHYPAIHILNGSLYGVLGLYEYLLVKGDDALRPVLTACIRGIVDELPKYDIGWWSLYSTGIRWHIAPGYYHKVHVKLLCHIGERFQLPLFIKYSDRWQCYQESRVSQIRHNLVEFIQINLNRVLTILNWDRIKYRAEARPSA